jgi:hypothetical protein
MARIHFVKKAQQRYQMVPETDRQGNRVSTPLKRRDGSPKVTKTGRPIVRRQTIADKSQPLPPRRCERCSKEIAVGTPYKWVAPKSGPYGGYKRYRCDECPSWKPSELSSAKTAPIMAAMEDLDFTGCVTKDDFVSQLEALADTVQEVADSYIESADNMEEGFGHSTSPSDELRQKGEDLESAADDLRNALDGEEDEPDSCDLHETNIIFDGQEPDEDEDDCDCQDRYDQWYESLSEAAMDAANNLDY